MSDICKSQIPVSEKLNDKFMKNMINFLLKNNIKQKIAKSKSVFNFQSFDTKFDILIPVFQNYAF